MAKIKDLAKLNEGDNIVVTDHEWQLKSVPGIVVDTLVPDEEGVEWVRVRLEMGDGGKLVSLFQSDISDGTTEVEKI